MLEYVSAKNLLKQLSKKDYIVYGNIKLPWKTYVKECELAVKKNSNYWQHNVDTNLKIWSKGAKHFLEGAKKNIKAGYTEHNTLVWKTTMQKPKINFVWENEIIKKLPLQALHAVATPTLQMPGNILPMHIDKFIFLKNTLGKNANIVRFLIFMKDWENGHALQVGNSWLANWSAGDVVLWYPNKPHLALNAGFTNKWTCNVTGILK